MIQLNKIYFDGKGYIQKCIDANNPQDPEWVNSFTDGNDKLLQQNFIDSQNYEKFQAKVFDFFAGLKVARAFLSSPLQPCW